MSRPGKNTPTQKMPTRRICRAARASGVYALALALATLAARPAVAQEAPASIPSSLPSSEPTSLPSVIPASLPSSEPTSSLSVKPASSPSSEPTGPLLVASSEPTSLPSITPALADVESPPFTPVLVDDERPARKKSPALAATLSILPVCPGCGHFYLEQYGTGAAYLGSAALLLGGLVATSSQADSSVANLSLPLTTTLQNLWFYGIFGTYRDARLMQGDEGYKRPITDETLPQLALASFRPRVLKSPWVWAGVPLMLGGALGLNSLLEASGKVSLGVPPLLALRGGEIVGGEVLLASTFLPVGIGEEALFRGVVQTGLSEWLGPWGGWAAGSVLFGAAHIPNFTGSLFGPVPLQQAVPALTYITAIGSVIGLAYMHTGYRLETGVAMHFWYDFGLSTIDFLSSGGSFPIMIRFGGAF